MPTRLIRRQRALDDPGERTLEMVMRKLSPSARAHGHILPHPEGRAHHYGSRNGIARHLAEAVPVPQSGPELLELKKP
jgi:hypothetical protein